MNNGYCFLVYYNSTSIHPRIFGPFESSDMLQVAVEKFTGATIEGLPHQRPKPVFGRKYKFSDNSEGFDFVVFDILEKFDLFG